MANAAVSGILLIVLGCLTLFRATSDVFCDNVKQVAATFPKETASSPLHFATTTFGQAPDAVYALALCRGDVANDDSACYECVASMFDKVLNSTPAPQQQCYNDVYYYGGLCFLVYSADGNLTSSNTTGENGDDSAFTGWNARSWGNWNWSTSNITGDADDVAVTVGLLNELLVKTVQTAASTTPMRFATAVMHSPTLFNFYSLAQCTPDLSSGDCLACLTRLLGKLNFTMTLRMGVQLHFVRCSLRYESYVFYNSQPMLNLSLPSTTPPTAAATPTTTAKLKSKLPYI